MSIFLRSKQGMAVIEPPPKQTVAELVAEGGGGDLWLEDADEPLDSKTVLADLATGSHISRSTCKKVATTVRFNDDKKTRAFPPGTTVERVFRWAIGDNGFDLPKAQRAKHTLAVCGTTTQPEKSTHLSELVEEGCAVCFDLAPKERFEG